MLKKTGAGASGKAKVTFMLTPHMEAHHVHLVGDFNDWENSTPMKRQKDGSWRATLELDPGREYQFRYLVDGNHWENDDAADAYVPNPFGADNSLLRLESAPGGPKAPARSGRGGGRSAATAGGGTQRGTASPAQRGGKGAGPSGSAGGGTAGARGGGAGDGAAPASGSGSVRRRSKEN